MTSRRFCVAALAIVAGCAGRGADTRPSPVSGRAAAEALLAHGAAAWDRGELDDFVSDYTPDATFVTARAVVHGRDSIRALYVRRFGPSGTRDVLHFENLEVDVVGPDALNAIAYYVLVH